MGKGIGNDSVGVCGGVFVCQYGYSWICSIISGPDHVTAVALMVGETRKNVAEIDLGHFCEQGLSHKVDGNLGGFFWKEAVK